MKSSHARVRIGESVEGSVIRPCCNKGSRCLLPFPQPIHRKIAHYLSPQKVYTTEDMRVLLASYPIDYLCVELLASEAHSSELSLLLNCETSLLKEVIICQADYQKCSPTVNALLRMSHLECLSLQVSMIAASLAPQFVERCCSSTNKRHFFDLDFTGTTPDQARPLIERLVTSDRNLVYLDLRPIEGWRDSDNMYLRCLTLPHVQLAHLRCFSVEFGEEGAELFARALEQNCSLRGVVLGAGPINDRGICRIGQALSKNATLKSLRLLNVGMNPATAAEFVKGLMSNQTLEQVTLKDEDIGEAGASALARLLRLSQKIRTLSLHYCDLGKKGPTYLVDAVERNRSLVELELVYCGISKFDVERLVSMCGNTLHRLRTDDSSISLPLSSKPNLITQCRASFKENFRRHLKWVEDTRQEQDKKSL